MSVGQYLRQEGLSVSEELWELDEVEQALAEAAFALQSVCKAQAAPHARQAEACMAPAQRGMSRLLSVLASRRGIPLDQLAPRIELLQGGKQMSVDRIGPRSDSAGKTT